MCYLHLFEFQYFDCTLSMKFGCLKLFYFDQCQCGSLLFDFVKLNYMFS